jgi:hypothetical protein
MEVDARALASPFEPRGLARPDVLVLLETHRHPELIARIADPRTVANHIAAQVDAELAPTLHTHASYAHSSPGHGWREVERAPEMAADIMREAMLAIPTLVVRHPHPWSLKQLDEVGRVMRETHLQQPVIS